LGVLPILKRGDLVHGKLRAADYGPRFNGWVSRTPTGLACVAPPTYEQDPRVRAIMRELVEREGGDCGQCRGCPIGKIVNQ